MNRRGRSYSLRDNRINEVKIALKDKKKSRKLNGKFNDIEMIKTTKKIIAATISSSVRS
jgi:hypothetical protein